MREIFKRLSMLVLTVCLSLTLVPAVAIADPPEDPLEESLTTPLQADVEEAPLAEDEGLTLEPASEESPELAPAYTYGWEGVGTQSSPYLVSNLDDLVLLSQLVNDGNSFSSTYFKLNADINIDAGWTPIGWFDQTQMTYRPFSGIFDGDGHTVSGMSISEYSTSDAVYAAFAQSATPTFGLFGYGVDCTIKNLDVISSIEAEGYRAVETSSIEASSVYTDGPSGSFVAGGIIGYLASADTGCVIDNCTFSGSISLDTLSACIGGIVGCIDGVSSISNCTNTATLTATTGAQFGQSTIGGIAGYVGSNDCTFTNCTNEGAITCIGGALLECGGIAGYTCPQRSMEPTTAVVSDGFVEFDSCSNSGTIDTGETSLAVGFQGGIGGILGESLFAENNLYNCFNTGDISTANVEIATGGLVGSNQLMYVTGAPSYLGVCTITNSYNAGDITGSGSVGGLGGSGQFLASNSYNKGTITGGQPGRSAVGGLFGYLMPVMYADGISEDAMDPAVINCYWIEGVEALGNFDLAWYEIEPDGAPDFLFECYSFAAPQPGLLSQRPLMFGSGLVSSTSLLRALNDHASVNPTVNGYDLETWGTDGTNDGYPVYACNMVRSPLAASSLPNTGDTLPIALLAVAGLTAGCVLLLVRRRLRS
ncbi:MAG: LPXTG cell wall anchor domain-containing protein [Actinobacteria bacterium]|nr:LPXTG cell wall anchor domain-containing protein [Actinomycetota bacterium]